jgi:hypothetical protein
LGLEGAFIEAERVERVKGIEPSYAAWEAAVLPLNYTRERLDFTGAEWPVEAGVRRSSIAKMSDPRNSRYFFMILTMDESS